MNMYKFSINLIHCVQLRHIGGNIEGSEDGGSLRPKKKLELVFHLFFCFFF